MHLYYEEHKNLQTSILKNGGKSTTVYTTIDRSRKPLLTDAEKEIEIKKIQDSRFQLGESFELPAVRSLVESINDKKSTIHGLFDDVLCSEAVDAKIIDEEKDETASKCRNMFLELESTGKGFQINDYGDFFSMKFAVKSEDVSSANKYDDNPKGYLICHGIGQDYFRLFYRARFIANNAQEKKKLYEQYYLKFVNVLYNFGLFDGNIQDCRKKYFFQRNPWIQPDEASVTLSSSAGAGYTFTELCAGLLIKAFQADILRVQFPRYKFPVEAFMLSNEYTLSRLRSSEFSLQHLTIVAHSGGCDFITSALLNSRKRSNVSSKKVPISVLFFSACQSGGDVLFGLHEYYNVEAFKKEFEKSIMRNMEIISNQLGLPKLEFLNFRHWLKIMKEAEKIDETTVSALYGEYIQTKEHINYLYDSEIKDRERNLEIEIRDDYMTVTPTKMNELLKNVFPNSKLLFAPLPQQMSMFAKFRSFITGHSVYRNGSRKSDEAENLPRAFTVSRFGRNHFKSILEETNGRGYCFWGSHETLVSSVPHAVCDMYGAPGNDLEFINYMENAHFLEFGKHFFLVSGANHNGPFTSNSFWESYLMRTLQ